MADTETEELTRELALSRARMTQHGTVFAERANVPKRLRKSVGSRPATWLATAAVIGLLIAVRRPKKRIEIKASSNAAQQTGKAAVMLGAAKLALDLFRPTLMALLRSKLSPGSPT